MLSEVYLDPNIFYYRPVCYHVYELRCSLVLDIDRAQFRINFEWIQKFSQ